MFFIFIGLGIIVFSIWMLYRNGGSFSGLKLFIRNQIKSKPFIPRNPDEHIWDYWKRIDYEPSSDIKRIVNSVKPNFYKEN